MKVMVCPLLWLLCGRCKLFVALAFPPIVADWIVVRVVVRDRTEGAGEENVLSPPLLDSWPPPMVRAVPVREDAPCDGAAIDLEVS